MYCILVEIEVSNRGNQSFFFHIKINNFQIENVKRGNWCLKIMKSSFLINKFYFKKTLSLFGLVFNWYEFVLINLGHIHDAVTISKVVEAVIWH